MLPWEHVIIGYLGYSVVCHLVYRDAPSGRETLIVGFASLLPDLIDKPLAWQFEVFPSGYALGHSIFFAVPLTIGVGLLARKRDNPWWGYAFGIGYLLHLPADVIPLIIQTGSAPIGRLLWPIVIQEGPTYGGLFAGLRHHLVPTDQQLLLLEPTPYLLAQLSIIGLAVAVWMLDGMPGPRTVYDACRRGYTVIQRRVTKN